VGWRFPIKHIGLLMRRKFNLNGLPQDSHVGLIMSALVGVFVTLLGVLQGIFSIQVSEKLTRF